MRSADLQLLEMSKVAEGLPLVYSAKRTSGRGTIAGKVRKTCGRHVGGGLQVRSVKKTCRRWQEPAKESVAAVGGKIGRRTGVSPYSISPL